MLSLSLVVIVVLYILQIVISYELNNQISIIGSGPTSLTLALALDKIGMKNINIYEQRESLSFDINQAFLYLIDGRGQKILSELNILDSIKMNAVSSYTFKNLTEIKANNDINILKLPSIDNNAIEKYWIPRHQFISSLYSKVLEKSNSITIHFNSKLEDIYYDDNELRLEFESSSLKTIPTDYIFGCDGVNSQVRNILSQNKFITNDNKRFDLVTSTSPSTGLRYKILPLLADFKYTNNEKKEIISNSTTAYAIRSLSTKPNQRLSLGLLPFTKYERRTANIIVKKDHELWKLKTYDDHLQFFEKSFPQISILNNLINKDDLVRFASSKGGTFPNIQYAKSLVKCFPQKGISLHQHHYTHTLTSLHTTHSPTTHHYTTHTSLYYCYTSLLQCSNKTYLL